MKFVSDPPIPVKIRKMQQRVRWRDPVILNRQIDQTRFVLDDGQQETEEFSFLVMGDTGVGVEQEQNAQRRIAEQMLPHLDRSRFVLHTGDVVYLVGSSEYYLDNFIKPYREFLVGGDRPQSIAYNQMIFKRPILPVPGNHDYYDLPLFKGLLTGLTLPLRRLLRFNLDFDIGWHGSYQGQAYTQAFLDGLSRFHSNEELIHHLKQHYNYRTETGWCLRYQPEKFTRLPNRYYTFRYGDIDFFALDSNTFNAPEPLPKTREGQARRRQLEEQVDQLEVQKMKFIEAANSLNQNSGDFSERISDLRTKIEQIEEVQLDIEKQLQAEGVTAIDHEQLDWLEQRLIESWQHPQVRGRIIFLHHPPYVTEATKWHQFQTLTIRRHLRTVFDRVIAALGELPKGYPLVNLIISGHAHCLEYIRTSNTGHADSHLNWIVCGGSGYSLRRQRQEGVQLQEKFGEGELREIARSHLFIGRNGQGSQKRRPYSFLRIDVHSGTPIRLTLRPFVVERYQKQWHHYAVDPVQL